MIPYDDLVAALSAWRARQGLPVSTMGGGGSSAAPSTASQTGSGGYGSGGYGQPGSGGYAQPGSGGYAQPGSGPYGQPGSGPMRGAPPPAPGRSKPSSIPPPLDEPLSVDDAEMLDEQYDDGGDYTVQPGNTDEATALGGAPDRPTDPNDFGSGRGGRGDW